ncbi:MAG: threonine/serine dehydratase [Synergistales bacterium]|jgi:threonine dehydratase|nr:threonine/serine dehydratase [Synergistales bacterium]
MGSFVVPTITDVLEARRFLRGRVRHTPTELSPSLSDRMGAPIFIKWENHQICGSFKLRGALNRMFSLSEEERSRGVVTASSGNHGQGVAMAASMLEVKAVICVPGSCPETKKAAIGRLGGEWVELRVVGRLYDDAEREAHEAAEREGRTYISSFEDRRVVAGAGTLGLELILDEPDLDLIVVPAGGGGLMNGVAIATKALRPSVEIWGVQSVASQPWVLSWPGGKVVETTYDDSLADGLTGSIPQSLLTLAKERVSGILAVTEENIAEAIAFCHREHHEIVEGAGAVGIAALLSGRIDVAGRRTAVVISGGNIDEERLLEVLNRHHAAERPPSSPCAAFHRSRCVKRPDR